MRTMKHCYNRNKFKDRRIAKGMSVQELANLMGVRFQTVYRWEDGTRTPSLYDTIRMAHHLGISIQELVDETDDFETSKGIFLCEEYRAALEGGGQ